MRRLDAIAIVLCLQSLGSGCATIPHDRYGVREVRITGADELAEGEIKACLATRERKRVDVTFGTREIGGCGEPPFEDDDPPSIALWSWPWTTWPLLDSVALEQDAERIERWYRARGFHEARVTGVEVVPPRARDDAVVPHDADADCDRGRGGQGCRAEVTFTVEEGLPTRVVELTLDVPETMPADLREALGNASRLAVGDRADEALYDQSKQAMREVLAARSHAVARVEAVMRVDRSARKAWLHYDVDPGPPCVFGDVVVEGSAHLPVEPIAAATLIDAGEPYEVEAMKEAQRAVASLGSISAAVVEPIVPERGHIVDVRVRVTPSRRQGFSLGAGIQAGELRTLTETVSVPQWDVHLLGRYRHTNLFGGLRQLTIEERPRLIFQRAFPQATVPRFGNVIQIGFRQPGFIEPRLVLLANASHTYGPDPYDVFFRHRVDTELAVERDFLGGALYLRFGIQNSVYRVPPGQSRFNGTPPPSSSLATFLEQVVRVELRDDVRRPHSGAFLQLAAQEAGYFLPSSWDFVRLLPDVRFYIPLPAHITIATRFALGMYFITGADDRLDTLSQSLGPWDMRLRGGGASSNRGFPPGRLGDGLEGGTRRWEASIEVRAPIAKNLELAVFGDMGDVSREERFRFDYPQAAAGFGIRYYTLVGAVRLDFAWKIPGLQVLAETDERINDIDSAGEPIGRGGGFAFHLTIGQPF